MVVLVAFVILCDAKLWRPDHVFTIAENIQIAEAQAWWQGRLDLPERKWDSALFEGKVYSPFPPMFTFVALPVVRFFDGVPHWFILALVVLPILAASYWLFWRLTGSSLWATVGALALIAGTSVLPVLDGALRGASPYLLNQALATLGLLVFLIEYFGRRRLMILGIGLAIAAWSRQLTIAYALPLLWAGWRSENPSARRRLAAVGIVGGVLAVLLGMNALKFGRPLDSGYAHIYVGREDDRFAHDARTHGLFAPHYFVRNLYYANVGLPRVSRITMAGEDQVMLYPNREATGIWWTTPLLLWLLADLRRIWADPALRTLLAAAVLANLALLFYHNTGAWQRGFNRFSLDYVPVLLALVGQRCFVGRRRGWSLGAVAWSVAYFAWLIRLPHLRVW